MLRIARVLLVLLLFAAAARAQDEESIAAEAKRRWAQSPYGPMLERILPPTFSAAQLPEPRSRGARLVLRYCVQCHNLPNPAMHDAARWPSVVDRMVARMQGRGNLGSLMKEMMGGIAAPDEGEERLLLGYLQRNGQKPLDPAKYPAIYRREGEAFRLACSQCHTLPDPQRHTAQEWPRVVARMQENMQWMNRVVGSDPREPQLRTEEIVAFLVKYARKR